MKPTIKTMLVALAAVLLTTTACAGPDFDDDHTGGHTTSTNALQCLRRNQEREQSQNRSRTCRKRTPPSGLNWPD